MLLDLNVRSRQSYDDNYKVNNWKCLSDDYLSCTDKLVYFMDKLVFLMNELVYFMDKPVYFADKL